MRPELMTQLDIRARPVDHQGRAGQAGGGSDVPVISLIVTQRPSTAEVSMAAQTAWAAAPSRNPGSDGAPGQPSAGRRPG
jgi:hypothetical protein